MAENTKIEWADHTFNPWIGCTKVSPACDHCYAETLATARLGVQWGPHAERRRTAASTWRQPLAWNRKAARDGTRPRVFCASLADVFDNAVPDEWRDDLADLIRATPNLIWLLLTKRIGNAAAMLARMLPEGMPANVWLGATIANQNEADRDVPKLLATPAAKRFLSMEPLLGPVDLTSIRAPRYADEPADSLDIDWRFDALTTGDHYWFDGENGQLGDCGDGPYRDARIDWVIAGGESGAPARPSHPDWYRALRDQCRNANLGGDDAPVPFLFKQWGAFSPLLPSRPALPGDPGMIAWPSGAVGRDVSADQAGGNGQWMYQATKVIAGRLLDGVMHDGVPS